jgi:hypothetical protein
MTIDHFGDLSIVRIFGFFTAAEGFVFISGIVSGMVYYKRLKQTSYTEIKKSAFKRALLVYKYHIICLLSLCLIIFIGNDFIIQFYNSKAPFFVNHSFQAAFLNATFIYKIYHLDILPMYVIFLLFVPFAIKHTENRGVSIVFIVSGLFWLINLSGLTELFYKGLNVWIPARLGEFEVLSWQFLFFMGFCLGILQFQGRLNLSLSNKIYFFISVLLLVGFFLLKWFGYSYIPATYANYLDSRQTLGIFRILNFLTLCYFIGFILTRFKKLGDIPFLQLLGRHSLYVFTFQTFILFTIIPFYNGYIVHGLFAEVFENKIVWKLVTLLTTIPLALTIILPALWRERKIKQLIDKND